MNLRRQVATAVVLVCSVLATESPVAADIGPDVIVVDLPSTIDYDRNTEIAALSVATTSCNIGDDLLQWQALPNNQHPVIAQNMYRLMNDRIEQIGQAWVKHGFLAINNGICGTCDGNVGSVLGVGCSDPYSTNLNSGPNLGSRSAINPVTGFFDGATANDHAGHVHSAIAHGLQVRHDDLAIPGARYFVEGFYITPDDAAAGNGNNNASYREVQVTGSSTNWAFANVGATVEQAPAIFAWDGASFAIQDSWPDDGRLIVAYKTTDLGGGQYHYEYALHNMNGDRGIQSISVPIGTANVTNAGFYVVPAHDEGYAEDPSNEPWTSSIDMGLLNWSTLTFDTDPNTSALRWGTMCNFWFDADVAPVPSAVSMDRFKPGPGADVVFARIDAPAPGDCNQNSIPDDDEIAADPSLDCNGDDFLDECQFAGNDCNGNSIPDECDLENNDCNGNGTPDECELTGNDCNGNLVLDECESPEDCNENGIPDVCDALTSDCNGNEVPDECENDCDRDGTIDDCAGEPDCNANGLPDSCDVTGEAGGLHDLYSGLVNIFFGPENISHSIEVTDGGIITDVDVTVGILHTWVADMIIRVEHNGTIVVLWNRDCGSLDNVFATFDDEGSPRICFTPTGGIITPISTGGTPLSAFDGMDPFGTWTLSITDILPGQDNGLLRDWTLTVEADDRPPFSADADQDGVPDECVCTGERGDMNGDGVVDADDIQSFTDAHMGAFSACADIDNNGAPLDLTDVEFFVDLLLGREPGAVECVDGSGDMNGDGQLDGNDVQGFVDAYLGGYSPCADMNSSGPPLGTDDLDAFLYTLLHQVPACGACPGDMNGDGSLNADDIQGFIDAYLGAFSACADVNVSGPPLTTTDIDLFIGKLLNGTGPCP